MTQIPLPINTVLHDLDSALARGNAILHAPPGAGKTTVVPLALRDSYWLKRQRIVMLEPRRLAARAAARRLAASIGEAPGQLVGYRMRMDTCIGRDTRIEVVTEGVLTRMLQNDPALDGVGLVIFDEYHERSLHADLGLALCLDAQNALCPELRLLVMSATLQTTELASMMGNASIVECHGRTFPVTTHYRPPRKDLPAALATAAAISSVLADSEGDVLAFLPGAREIRAAAAQLERTANPKTILIAPLYGNLDDSAQERAIGPAPPGRRKIVLATNIAETSLTIDGIRCVVDSGLRRAAAFDPGSGMSRLRTVQISRASADQRRGRAGRTAPGVCIRLWSRDAHNRLPGFSEAEMHAADLAPLALELALWGVRDPGDLQWLDPPPDAAWSRSKALLHQLGAIDEEGGISRHGRDMAGLGAHPRLAHMLLTANAFGAGAIAADLAAVLSERDCLRFDRDAPSADLEHRLAALKGEQGLPAGATVNRTALRQARAAASRWRRQLAGRKPHRHSNASTGVVLATAYPDRIAQRRTGRHHCYRTTNGRGACLRRGDALARQDWLAIADADAGSVDGLIYLAAALRAEDLETYFGQAIRLGSQIGWDPASQAVKAVQVTSLGALTLTESPLVNADPEQVCSAMICGIRRAGIEALPWTPESRSFCQRVTWLASLPDAPGGLDWPSMTASNLLEQLEQWLAPWLAGVTRLAQLARLSLPDALASLLTHRHLQALEALAPRRLQVPSGSRLALDYDVDTVSGQTPVLRVKLQEMFGAEDTPRLAGGSVPVTVHLLSPAGRPVQITRDLASFWGTTYHEVRRDLKGRYPKHYWPEDPHSAIATRRVRPPRL